MAARKEINSKSYSSSLEICDPRGSAPIYGAIFEAPNIANAVVSPFHGNPFSISLRRISLLGIKRH